MADSLALVDMFVRGIAVGGMGVLGLSFAGSGASRDIRLTTSLASLSICCWLITESHALWGALGHTQAIMVPAYPVAAMFWLFVVTAFEDRPLSPALWMPAAILMVTGFICQAIHSQTSDWLWAARNVFSALLSLHAAIVIAKGWSGDLLEARRRLRGLILGFAALFAVTNTVIGLVERGRHGPWMMWTAGEPYGGAVFAVIIMATATIFLQARPVMFSPVRRAAQLADTRADAAERLMLQRLEALMAADGWRQEGLTIGELARRLDAPEHRVRRLINHRLGHRNFAEFLNAHRIEAAKQRLADPQEARTTVAVIAFDLGYGSLGPFNRAFRAATGASPTEWRREALQASPELREAV